VFVLASKIEKQGVTTAKTLPPVSPILEAITTTKQQQVKPALPFLFTLNQ
jgi:hypothetical protein